MTWASEINVALIVGFTSSARGALRRQLVSLGLRTIPADSCEGATSLLHQPGLCPALIFVDIRREAGWDIFGRSVQSGGGPRPNSTVAPAGPYDAAKARRDRAVQLAVMGLPTVG